MKTSVIEVHDMLSVLSVDGVEKRIGEVQGVESVTVNFAAGSATVRYDETRLKLADIKSGVRQIGNEADDAPAAASAKGHAGQAAPGERPAAPKSSTGQTGTVGAAPSGAAQEVKGAPSAPPKPSPTAPTSAAAPATPKSTPAAAPAGDQQKSEAPAKS